MKHKSRLPPIINVTVQHVAGPGAQQRLSRAYELILHAAEYSEQITGTGSEKAEKSGKLEDGHPNIALTIHLNEVDTVKRIIPDPQRSTTVVKGNKDAYQDKEK